MVSLHLLANFELGLNMSRKISKGNDGYEDCRKDETTGERFYLDQGKIQKHHRILRKGVLNRVAAEGRFISSSKKINFQKRRTKFSDFIVDHFEKEASPIFKKEDIIDFGVPQDLIAEAKKVLDPSFSFRFTYENRKVEIENSLGQKRKRADQTKVVRIDYKTKINGLPMHFRKFLHNPSASDLKTSIDDFLEQNKKLKNVETIEAGTTAVLFHPTVASVFAHEVFGHMAERVRTKMDLEVAQRMFDGVEINVTDKMNDSKCLVRSEFDDEGVKAKNITILKNGAFQSAITNLETAFALNQTPNGRGRSQDFRYEPICRMNNIVIEKGNQSLEELFKAIKSGYYFIGSLGGLLSESFFQVQTQYGYKIVNGKISHPVQGCLLMGILEHCMQNIQGVENKVEWIEDGGCYGGGQFLELSGRASPHLHIKDLRVL